MLTGLKKGLKWAFVVWLVSACCSDHKDFAQATITTTSQAHLRRSTTTTTKTPAIQVPTTTMLTTLQEVPMMDISRRRNASSPSHIITPRFKMKSMDEVMGTKSKPTARQVLKSSKAQGQELSNQEEHLFTVLPDDAFSFDANEHSDDADSRETTAMLDEDWISTIHPDIFDVDLNEEALSDFSSDPFINWNKIESATDFDSIESSRQERGNDLSSSGGINVPSINSSSSPSSSSSSRPVINLPQFGLQSDPEGESSRLSDRVQLRKYSYHITKDTTDQNQKSPDIEPHSTGEDARKKSSGGDNSSPLSYLPGYGPHHQGHSRPTADGIVKDYHLLTDENRHNSLRVTANNDQVMLHQQSSQEAKKSLTFSTHDQDSDANQEDDYYEPENYNYQDSYSLLELNKATDSPIVKTLPDIPATSSTPLPTVTTESLSPAAHQDDVHNGREPEMHREEGAVRVPPADRHASLANRFRPQRPVFVESLQRPIVRSLPPLLQPAESIRVGFSGFPGAPKESPQPQYTYRLLPDSSRSPLDLERHQQPDRTHEPEEPLRYKYKLKEARNKYSFRVLDDQHGSELKEKSEESVKALPRYTYRPLPEPGSLRSPDTTNITYESQGILDQHNTIRNRAVLRPSVTSTTTTTASTTTSTTTVSTTFLSGFFQPKEHLVEAAPTPPMLSGIREADVEHFSIPIEEYQGPELQRLEQAPLERHQSSRMRHAMMSQHRLRTTLNPPAIKTLRPFAIPPLVPDLHHDRVQSMPKKFWPQFQTPHHVSLEAPNSLPLEAEAQLMHPQLRPERQFLTGTLMDPIPTPYQPSSAATLSATTLASGTTTSMTRPTIHHDLHIPPDHIPPLKLTRAPERAEPSPTPIGPSPRPVNLAPPYQNFDRTFPPELYPDTTMMNHDHNLMQEKADFEAESQPNPFLHRPSGHKFHPPNKNSRITHEPTSPTTYPEPGNLQLRADYYDVYDEEPALVPRPANNFLGHSPRPRSRTSTRKKSTVPTFTIGMIPSSSRDLQVGPNRHYSSTKPIQITKPTSGSSSTTAPLSGFLSPYFNRPVAVGPENPPLNGFILPQSKLPRHIPAPLPPPRTPSHSSAARPASSVLPPPAPASSPAPPPTLASSPLPQPSTTRIAETPAPVFETTSGTSASNDETTGYEPESSSRMDDILDSTLNVLRKHDLTVMAALLTEAKFTRLLSGKGNYTLFVPTDKAFSSFFDALGGVTSGVQHLRRNPDDLKRLLENHIVVGRVPLIDLDEDLVGKSLSGSSLRANIFLTENEDWTEIKVMTINGGVILDGDHEAENAIIHRIDRVLFPPAVGNIVQTLKADPAKRFTTFIKALKATKLDAQLEDFNTGPWTVFAPTNDAFLNLPMSYLEEIVKSPEKLQKMVLKHLVNRSMYSAGLKSHQRIQMANGSQVNLYARSDRLKLEGSNVMQMDIPATNGVIQVIEHVLELPDFKFPPQGGHVEVKDAE